MSSYGDSDDPIVLKPSDVYNSSRLIRSVVKGEAPDLIPTGIGFVDNATGGMSRGELAIVAADTGIGKSSLIEASLPGPLSGHRHGVISLEDKYDRWAERMAARITGIDSLRIRMGRVSEEERQKVEDAEHQFCEHYDARFVIPAEGTIASVVRSTHLLAAAGCDLIWLDYLHKLGGSGLPRKDEVKMFFTKFQEACFKDDIAGVAVCQLRRLGRDERNKQRTLPDRHDVKDSGDLSNECRMMVLGRPDLSVARRSHWFVEKSNSGGEGVTCQYMRNESGVLEPERVKVPY